MIEEVKINKQANSITFTNNNISFSQFGIAKEILELIENQQSEIERLNKESEQLRTALNSKESIIKEVREYIGLSDELRKLCTNYDVNGIGILKILDKEKK